MTRDYHRLGLLHELDCSRHDNWRKQYLILFLVERFLRWHPIRPVYMKFSRYPSCCDVVLGHADGAQSAGRRTCSQTSCPCCIVQRMSMVPRIMRSDSFSRNFVN